MKYHVWFLFSGGPTRDKTIREYLSEQLHDPFVQQSLPSFLRFLWVWLLLKNRTQVPLLKGPCLSFDAAQSYTNELYRLIGPDFVCTPIHHFGQSDLERHIKSLPPKAKVILLPMIPHRCRTLFSALERCRQALRQKGNSFIEWGLYNTHPAFIEGLACLIRQEIIARKQRDYALLYMAQRQPEQWNSSPQEYNEDLKKTISALQQYLSCAQPKSLMHPHGKKVKKLLEQWYSQGIRSLITVPVSFMIDSELLQSERAHITQTAQDMGYEAVLHSKPVSYAPPFNQHIMHKLYDIQSQPHP